MVIVRVLREGVWHKNLKIEEGRRNVLCVYISKRSETKMTAIGEYTKGEKGGWSST